ncbi:MAG: transcription termination/antitermination protein NusG [Lachnospiraceae bacterium]|nr:transcription termination/antitermination protein NusG [Lachnospiraceae bacterium]
MAEANWYVVHTYSGYENKVMDDIRKTIENRGLQDQILDVKVPLQDVEEIRNGKRKPTKRKRFPGYVMVHMIMNEETWYVVRNTRGVTGFVGPGSKPVPLSPQDLLLFESDETEVDVDFEVGDLVTVVADNGYKDQQGVVKDINLAEQTVTISIEMFGRETPVELGLTDVSANS